MWLRFIDDMFIIWNGTKTEFDRYFQTLNNNDTGLQFTYESSGTEIVLLDTKIYISKNCMHTTLYRKPTVTNAVLHATSHHSKTLVWSIPFGELLRAKHNCSSSESYLAEETTIISRFRERGYPQRV